MDIETLQRLYVEEKLTLEEIAKRLNSTRYTVKSHLLKNGIKLRDRKEAQQNRFEKEHGLIDIESILFLIDVVKMTVTEVTEYYGVSRNAIWERLSINGYNLRNHREQRMRQSKFMKENNPVPKGTKRDAETVAVLKEAKQKMLQEKIDTFSPKNFHEYAKFARYLSYKNFQLKTPQGFHIDHIYSIRDGYDNNVPIEIISHKNNLRLIKAEENLSKGSKSDISCEELYRRVGVQRLSRKGVEGSPSKSRTA